MLTIKEAVKAAVMEFEDLFPSEAADLRLEEVDHAQSDNAWKITISITNPDFDRELETQKVLSPTARILGVNEKIPTRTYKSILLDSESGKLVSIKNV